MTDEKDIIIILNVVSDFVLKVREFVHALNCVHILAERV